MMTVFTNKLINENEKDEKKTMCIPTVRLSKRLLTRPS